jgi:N6-L-threonylcarbamoyladenine synthase
MIALAGAMRLQSREIETLKLENKFTINARWDLEMEAIGQEV